MRSIASVLLLTVGVAGCGHYTPTPLPDLPAAAVSSCGAAAAKAGEDARVAAKRKEVARRCEKAKREAVVSFYVGLQSARK